VEPVQVLLIRRLNDVPDAVGDRDHNAAKPASSNGPQTDAIIAMSL
jgi:hypothetical protein